MKALKYRSGNSNITSTALLAASLATTLSCLGINVASAQSDTAAAIKTDSETCQALNDSTALDDESIKQRIACYNEDVEHLNLLVTQLTSERDDLVANADIQSSTIEEYKQKLAQRQDAMQRLEERAAELALEIDNVTADRNHVRDQLINMINDNKDQPAEVTAHKIIFENFSQSYMSLTNKIEELRNRLTDFESKNTELSKQQYATQAENQQVRSQNGKLSAEIASLEESVATLGSEKEELQTNLTTVSTEVDNINNQLLEKTNIAEQQFGEIKGLKESLGTSESQRQELEATILSLNEQHLQELTELTKQTDALNGEIDTLNEQRLTLQEQKKQASEESQAIISTLETEKEELQANLTTVSAEVDNINNQLLEKTNIAEQQLGEITDLKKSLDTAESQRQELEGTILTLNERHLLELTELTNQTDALNGEIDTLNEQRLTLQEQKKQASEESQAIISALETDREDLQANLTTVSAEVDNINNQLLETTNIAEQRLGEITNLNAAFGNLKAALDNAESQRQELEGTISTLNERHLLELTELTNQTDALNGEIDTLNEQRLTLQEQKKQASEESQAIISALETDREDLQANLTTVSAEVDNINNQLLETTNIAEQRLGEITNLNAAFGNLKAALDNAESQRQELEGTISTLNEQHLLEVTELTNQTDALNGEIDTLNEQRRTLQEQKQQAADESQAVISARDDEIAQLSSRQQELNAEREKLLADIASLEKSHLQQTQSYEDQASELEAQIASITTEKSSLDSQLQEQKKANDSLKIYAKTSNDKSVQLNLEANELREELSAADAQAEQLQSSIVELGQQSKSDKARFTKQVADLNFAIESTQKERDELAAELDIVQPQLTIAEDNLRSSVEKNNTLVASVETLEQKLTQAAQEQENLTASLLDTETKRKLANENLESLKNNAKTLTTLLSKSRAHSKNADATLKELKSEISNTNTRLKEIQTELDTLLAEKIRIEKESRELASKARSHAKAIEVAMLDAGHESFKVAVGENNAIGILLGSGQLFRVGSARLSQAGQLVLSDLASNLNATDKQRIMISGHSDDVPLGSKLAKRFKDNWGLSMARALATADFFSDEANIPADRISVSGFGATRPIADNDTPEGRQQNRRVEISLVSADETVASSE